MPKHVGTKRPEFVEVVGNNKNTLNGFTRVSRSQFDIIVRWLTFNHISTEGVFKASYDTTDKGGPKTLAKRWWRWFVSTDAIRLMEEKNDATEALRKRALAVPTK